MPRVGGNLTHRFRKVGSRTPLYREDNQKFYWNHCWYCGCELIYDRHMSRKKANSFTRDHLYPASLGGGKGNNTVPACNKCNQEKRTLTLGEFRIVRFGVHGGKFFAEQREEELKVKLAKKEIRPTMQAQLAMILQEPPKPAYRPKVDKSIIYREQFVVTPLSCILRFFFKAF